MIEITTQNLTDLIAHNESETIEFKESFGDEAIETIGAFSNARGGHLLIGVRNSGQIAGLQIGKKTLEDIANRIQEATDPRLQPSLSIIKHEGKNVVVIHVLPTTGMPISIKGRYFRRVGRTNQRMSHEEIMQRLISRSGLSWDAYIEDNTTLSDLSEDLIEQFILSVRETGRLSLPEKAKSEDVLRKVELIQDSKPTRAALLLFGKNPNSFFSAAFLKLGRFRSPTHIVDDREIYGTLNQQLEGAMSWFRERLETEFIISGNPAREVRWEYPLKAIREAAINLLCHRDYSSAAHSQIRLYDDRLEFWNAGGLPPALTPEALFHDHDSIPRNRKIAMAFYYSGLIEKWGSGTLRMVEELESARLPTPKFITDSSRFRLVFYKQFNEEILKKLGLTKRQLSAIAYVRQHGSITNTEYQSISNISKPTATRDLIILKKKGILISEGVTGRGTLYKFKGS